MPPLAAGGQLVAEAKTLTEAMAERGVTAQLPVGQVEEEGGSGWRLQVLLSQEGAKAGDVQNYVGVLTGHVEGWDPDDLPDPPMPIEGSARVMVDRTGRAQDRGWYATDYQGPGEPGWEWPLRVESVQGGRRVTLTFRGLTGLPDGITSALVDVRSNLRIDLAEGSSYRFFPGTNAGQPPLEGVAVEHAFRLVVGSTSFVDARTAGTIRLPAEASLDQNYPNPFNPTTTIRFALAEPSRVRLTVLNVRGQQVAVLADGLYNAGPHTLQWDGRDATGRAAASGIYFYRLEAAGKVISKKMTLIR